MKKSRRTWSILNKSESLAQDLEEAGEHYRDRFTRNAGGPRFKIKQSGASLPQEHCSSVPGQA